MVNTRTSVEPETPSTGAEAPAPVPVPPSTTGLSQRGQQQVLLGETPNNSGTNNNNNNGTTATSMGSTSMEDTHMGLEAALRRQIGMASQGDYVTEFERQQKVQGNNNDEAKNFMYKQFAALDVRVFGFLPDNSSDIIRFGFAVSQFPDGDDDIGDAIIMFVGNRNKFNNNDPPMYKIPPDNGVKWTSVKTNYDAEDLVKHYSVPENKGKFRTGGSGSSKHIPRMIYLPHEAGLAVVQKECTPYQLVEELIRLEEDPNCRIEASHTTFVKAWCAAAMVEGAKNKSKLAMNLTAITTQNPKFFQFKHLRAIQQLGDPSGSPPKSSNDDTPRKKAYREEINEMKGVLKEAAMIVAASTKSLATSNSIASEKQASATPVAQLCPFDGSLLAAVKGYSGKSDKERCRVDTWSTVLSKKKLNDKRDYVLEKVEEWAADKGYTICKTFRLDKTFFKDMEDGNFTVGEARATEFNLGRGFSPHHTLGVSFQFKAMMDAREQAEDDTEHTRTFCEKLELLKQVERQPPEDIDEFTVNTNTYTGLVYTFYGDACPLYHELESVCAILNSPVVTQAKSLYSLLAVRQYHFAIANGAVKFFSQRVRESEFSRDCVVWPKTSLADQLIPAIEDGREVPNICFPTSWLTSKKAPQQQYHAPPPPQLALPPPQGAVPMPPQHPAPGHPGVRNPFQERSRINNDVHNIIKQEWAPVIRKNGGTLPSLKGILKGSGNTMDDLPKRNKFKMNGNNMLCYTWVLGECRKGGCQLIHPGSRELEPDFCREINTKTKKGREKFLSGTKRKRGDDEE